MLIGSMTIQQALQREIEDSKRWIEWTQEDSPTSEIFKKEFN
jgi:hypothetical protein